MSFREIGLWFCLVSLILALGRIAYLLLWRRPVLARVIGTDYTEMQRGYDKDFRRTAYWDMQTTSDDIPFRPVLVRARYDWNGESFAEDVRVYVRKGDTPDRQLILWIDPADPRRATAAGIGLAVVGMLATGMVAVAIFFLSS